MYNKKLLPVLDLLVIAVLAALLLAACTPAPTPQPSPEAGNANMANPASVYCEEQGYTVEIRTASDGSQSGVCVFGPGDECDEWQYFRGECGPAGESAAPGFTPVEDAVLAYLAQAYPQDAPALDLEWQGQDVTPQDLVGAQHYAYTAGDWTLTIIAPVVAPESTVYNITLSNAASGWMWEGQLDKDLNVSEVR